MNFHLLRHVVIPNAKSYDSLAFNPEHTICSARSNKLIISWPHEERVVNGRTGKVEENGGMNWEGRGEEQMVARKRNKQGNRLENRCIASMQFKGWEIL